MKKRNDFSKLVTKIVDGYVSRNPLRQKELPQFTQVIHQSLERAHLEQLIGTPSRSKPAVSIEESITPEYLVCLEDGKPCKMLGRHVRDAHHLTPKQYRKRWGLPNDYPMIAPNYAKQRSNIAKKMGLGQGNHGRGRPKKRKVLF